MYRDNAPHVTFTEASNLQRYAQKHCTERRRVRRDRPTDICSVQQRGACNHQTTTTTNVKTRKHVNTKTRKHGTDKSHQPVPQGAEEDEESQRHGRPLGVVEEWRRQGHQHREDELRPHEDHLGLERGGVERLVLPEEPDLPHQEEHDLMHEVGGARGEPAEARLDLGIRVKLGLYARASCVCVGGAQEPEGRRKNDRRVGLVNRRAVGRVGLASLQHGTGRDLTRRLFRRMRLEFTSIER